MGRRKLPAPRYELKQNSRGLWELRWSVDRKVFAISARTRDEAEARRKYPLLLAQATAPKVPPSVNVQAIGDGYLADQQRKVDNEELSVEALKSLRYALLPILGRLGVLTPDLLNDKVMEDYARWRMNQPNRNKTGTIGAGTVIKEVTILRAALNWAHRQKWIAAEPALRSPVEAPDARQIWLEREDARRLVAACPPWLALYVRIAVTCAQRRQAVLDLEWNRVTLPPNAVEWFNDVERGIEYRRMKPSVNVIMDFGKGTGRKMRGRKVPIGENVPLHDALVAAKAVATTPYVIERDGKKVHTLRRALEDAYQRAGVDHQGAISHILKHTGISLMARGGVEWEKISSYTGTSVKTLKKVYGHLHPDYAKDIGAATAIV